MEGDAGGPVDGDQVDGDLEDVGGDGQTVPQEPTQVQEVDVKNPSDGQR